MLVMILSMVESADFLFLERETGLTKGNLSAHLSKLEGAEYIRIEKTFKGRYPLTICKLTPAGKRALSNYRARLGKVLGAKKSGA
jgi:DNA-binding transcriptional ArsR family regulator